MKYLFICFALVLLACNSKAKTPDFSTVKSIEPTETSKVKSDATSQTSNSNEHENPYRTLPKFNCSENHDLSTQIGINLCTEETYAFYDKRLNDRYNVLLNTIDTSPDYDEKAKQLLKASLKESQRAWVRTKETNAKILELLVEDSQQSQMISKQATMDTKNRLVYLGNLLRTITF